jgi:hypothetical protein
MKHKVTLQLKSEITGILMSVLNTVKFRILLKNSSGRYTRTWQPASCTTIRPELEPADREPLKRFTIKQFSMRHFSVSLVKSPYQHRQRKCLL